MYDDEEFRPGADHLAIAELLSPVAMWSKLAG